MNFFSTKDYFVYDDNTCMVILLNGSVSSFYYRNMTKKVYKAVFIVLLEVIYNFTVKNSDMKVAAQIA